MTIGIWGDSITWGAYDPENGGWATLLRGSLEPRDIEIYNCGISGDTSKDLIKRFKVEAEARQPEVVAFAVGINDSCYRKNTDNVLVSKEDFQKNLQELISQAKTFTEKIILIGLTKVEESKVTPIPWSTTGKCYNNQNIQEYNTIIENISTKNSLNFISMLDVLSESDLADGLHPNTIGHKKIFEVIKNELEKLISPNANPTSPNKQ